MSASYIDINDVPQSLGFLVFSIGLLAYSHSKHKVASLLAAGFVAALVLVCQFNTYFGKQ